MARYECKIAQNGFAAGKAFVLCVDHTIEYTQETPSEEKIKFESAMEYMNRKLIEEKNQKKGSETDLIDAEISILNSEEFAGEVKHSISEEKKSAPEAVKSAADKLCEMLNESGNEYIIERCSDIIGLSNGLIAFLKGMVIETPKTPFILVGKNLSPGEMTMVGTSALLGIITETGSPTSHVSVLAGNLDIPYLYGLDNISDKIKDDDYLILDAEENMVLVNPDEEKVKKAELHQKELLSIREEQRQSSEQIATKTKIYANISSPEEIEILSKNGADGIGLLRSEFLFLNRANAPTEEEQFEAYSYVVKAMKGKEIIIRTMDIGSDKQANWMKLPKELNPALGMRGLRISLANKELFRTQLRAILRTAKYGNVRIMLPMVTSLWEFEEAEKEISLAAEELKQRGESYDIPKTGVMIETPAAVMIAPSLAKKAKFFSIGTNDLTQYTLAVDRDAAGMDKYIDPMHDAVMQMIKLTVEAAHENGIPVAVCGEIAGKSQAIEQLVQIGVDELSVSASKLQKVRGIVADAEKKVDQAGTGKHTFENLQDDIKCPAEGELIPMEEIPDPVFSGGIMGECVGILSKDGKIYAPISGIVSTVATTKHAISFKNSNVEILVHVGLDTVKMNGEGFKVHVKEGDEVKQEQLVMEADLKLIRSKGLNPMVIVVRVE